MSVKKKSAPNAATSEGTKVINNNNIIPHCGKAVKEEIR